MIKVAVAIHGTEYVDFGVYVNHLGFLRSLNPKYEVSLITVRNAKVAQARNEIYMKAKELGVEYLFFLDTDHYVPRDTLDCLMESIEYGAIVSGVVCRRRPDYDQIGYIEKDGVWYKTKFLLDGRAYKVSTCAFGCTLIKMIALEELKVPVFEDISLFRKEGTKYSLRSDVYLCKKLLEKGFDVLIDTRVIVGHVGEPVVVYPSNGKFLLQNTDAFAPDVEEVNKKHAERVLKNADFDRQKEAMAKSSD